MQSKGEEVSMIISEDKKSPKRSICNVILNYLDHLCVYSLDPYVSCGNMCFRVNRKRKEEMPQLSYPKFPRMGRVNPSVRIMA